MMRCQIHRDIKLYCQETEKRERLLLAMCMCSHFPLNVHLYVAIGNDSLCVALKLFFFLTVQNQCLVGFVSICLCERERDSRI